MDVDAKQRALTIYLLQESIRNESYAVVNRPLKEFEIIAFEEKIGKLFIDPREGHRPPWADFFSGRVSMAEFGWVSSSSAVFIVEASQRLFAITFGQGRHLIAQGAIEERFGLKVALNSIPTEKLKSIDKRSFDSIDSQSRIQASQDAEVQDFGIDVEQDLLRAVTGTPSDESLGLRITGRDALHVIIYCEIENINVQLSRYLEISNDDSYKEKFLWVDNISEISKGSAPGKELDERLLKELLQVKKNKKMDRCWLSIPEILEWERVSGFKFSGRYEAPIHHDAHILGFLDYLGEEESISIDLLSRRQVIAVNADGVTVNKWSIYKCLHCEIEENDGVFVLSAGRWYSITRELSEKVNQFYSKIDRYRHSLPIYSRLDKGEASYCERAARENSDSIFLMDQKFIKIKGRTNDIELCDLLTRDKKLIHIKRYGASKVLNHLFSQGLMSGESLKTLEGFVSELNKLLPTDFRVVESSIPVDVRGYTVVFAIISESKKEDLIIPFFARVSLRQVAKRLASMNYSVSIAKISVADDVRDTLRFLPERVHRRNRRSKG